MGQLRDSHAECVTVLRSGTEKTHWWPLIHHPHFRFVPRCWLLIVFGVGVFRYWGSGFGFSNDLPPKQGEAHNAN